MQYATQDVSPLDRSGPRRAWHERHRTALIDALMGPGSVVVGDIRRQYTAEMVLSKDQDLVQTLLSNGANPAFREGIRIWCPHRSPDHGDFLGPEDGVKGPRELGVTIVDQEADGEIAILDLPAQVTRLHPEGPRSPTRSSALRYSQPDGHADCRPR